MSYVDAIYNKEKDLIHVVERIDGVRKYRDYPAKYVFYYQDPKGKYTSIYGEKLSRVAVNTNKAFEKEKRIYSHKRLYESDLKPVFRCLEDNYLNGTDPTLNVCFFDIEVAFDKNKGFADPSDPFNPITSITLYLGWLERLITLCIKPDTMHQADAEAICAKFDNTVLCNTEHEMLELFLSLIDDADIFSGWNSEGFDIPYMVNRITRIMGKDHNRAWCLWNHFPKAREYEKFGKTAVTYDFVGRVHLDYLELYQKYTYHELHTYRLDYVGEIELGERKVQYDGTLDQLYHNDFEKFIAYNRQDVMLLVKMDKKLQYIDLVNVLAHANTVLLRTTMGAVAVTDQAVINEAHSRGLVVPDRVRGKEGETQAAGAYVAYPKKGLHEWIGSMDLNSLYPSVIRALNMSPETVVGHIRPEATDKLIFKRMKGEKKTFADAWNGMFGTLEYNMVMNQEITPITVDFEDGSSSTLSASEVYDLVFNSGKRMTISANGTIFTLDKQGIIPGLLARWYAERKQLQAEMRKYAKMADEATDPEEKAEYKRQADFYDQRQLIKKILLNSLYGAIGNPGSRWYDPRVAQSTTLSGRCIVKHMQSKINEIIAGDYNHLGISCIYGDTDSAYFSAYQVMKDLDDFRDFEWSKENVTDLYDKIGEMTNASFPEFMQQAFNCPADNGAIIRAARELCAIKGLFITKKRYAVLIYDKEGKRKDQNGKSGEIKAMGLDLKRSDTPKVVQDFLSDLLTDVLTGATEDDIQEKILEFRKEFRSWPGWLKGSPKRANKITHYESIMTNQNKMDWKGGENKKVTIPGHVLASINWNRLKKINSDHYSMPIQDGFKVIVCKLKINPSGITSVAYPVDELNLPKWFKELPFDDEAMETALIDKKVKNLLSVLNWDLDSNRHANSFNDLFSF